ncbi:glycosyl hydrolase [Thalassomonas sp. M1454]|nr:glycosyl hydrolase [Thalassomonas sp. M1454]
MTHANAICYSGYREGQGPGQGIYPSYEQIKQDLLILTQHWHYIRLYDCGPHAELTLSVISNENLDLKVMLGADVGAEMSNPNCPWGADYSDEKLQANKLQNIANIDKLIALSTKYQDIIFSVSIGNEASVDWTDHMVPVDRLISFVHRIKANIKQPVTFCENYIPWVHKLADLVAELDFISIHTYPAWEYKSIDEALDYTKQNYHFVANQYPDTPVVITEAGWTTQSNGRGIEPWNASQEIQASYYKQLVDWSNEEQILTFVFEAFDEPWKGSEHPQEPEKHWGLFTVDRQPKLVMNDLFASANEFDSDQVELSNLAIENC